MATDSTGLVGALSAWRDRTTARLQEGARGPVVRLLRSAVLLGIIALLVVQLTRVGWGAILVALPTHPGFYVLLIGIYLALPITEVFIYRPLWQHRARDLFLACARKRVLNEEVLGYTGEVFLYLWTTRQGIESSRAFRTVRDVNILSSAVSFTVAGILVGIMIALGELDLSGWLDGQALYIGAGIVVAAGIILLGVRFRSYVFALPLREAFRVGALHGARHLITTLMLVAMWHLAQPSISLGVWLSFAAILVVIERLPFLPSKDLVFLGASVELSKTMTLATAAMAGMLLVQSAVFKALHLVVFAVSAVALREEQDPSQLTPGNKAKPDSLSKADFESTVRF
ncbi:MAG: hypothetical protein HKN04_10930 [Rhodothermaceae bacterium]|nr:hypothetical protein [Rhodothermaceae bacterium]